MHGAHACDDGCDDVHISCALIAYLLVHDHHPMTCLEIDSSGCVSEYQSHIHSSQHCVTVYDVYDVFSHLLHHPRNSKNLKNQILISYGVYDVSCAFSFAVCHFPH
ncbi:hypothetical protein PanWU01x14_056050 [Parasponia andersonii]|uniref:Uncharacterized protein n=1 Tax=Parasponia andersonii TaxID=3476 RepID=A0A2P5DK85_PARAD|nr:hypothetical protein PanWU01x14_056050 [Parasponia andersonii]